MCGNVGVINREEFKVDSDKMITYFKQALFSDTLRGKHGTGIAAVDINGDIYTYKKAMTAPDFLDLSRTKSLVDNPNNIFLAGHNRWATQGSHTDENTHPFNHDHITMFHNGTLSTVSDLPNGKEFTVDSNAIAHALSVQSTKKTLESLDGAFALVWYDSKRESINFARNKERPLWFGAIKGSDSFVYASEKEMMIWLSGRNNISVDKIYELPIGRHIEVPLSLEEDIKITPFTPKIKSYSSYNSYYTPPTKSSLIGKIFSCLAVSWEAYPNNPNIGCLKANLLDKGSVIECNVSSVKIEDSKRIIGTTIDIKVTSSSTGYTYGVISTIGTVTSINSKIKNLPIISKEEDEVYFETIDKDRLLTRVGPNVEMITQEKYEDLTKHGCSVCSCNILSEDDCDISWDLMNNPFCPNCSKTELYS